MFYITKRDSETGKKFADLQQLFAQSHKEKVELAKKYGFGGWTEWQIGFGIANVVFAEGVIPDEKLWKPSKSHNRDCYKPNLRTKVGRALQNELNSAKRVYPQDINFPVLRDHPDNPWMTIGFRSAGNYYGFETPAKWKYELPADCEEVTSIKYKELFPEAKNVDN